MRFQSMYELINCRDILMSFLVIPPFFFFVVVVVVVVFCFVLFCFHRFFSKSLDLDIRFFSEF